MIPNERRAGISVFVISLFLALQCTGAPAVFGGEAYGIYKRKTVSGSRQIFLIKIGKLLKGEKVEVYSEGTRICSGIVGSVYGEEAYIDLDENCANAVGKDCIATVNGKPEVIADLFKATGSTPANRGEVKQRLEKLSAGVASSYGPEYVKDVVAYKEGSDGVFIYFILADSSGAMTASRGKVNIRIAENEKEWNSRRIEFEEHESELYVDSFDIKSENFEKASVGRGSFAHTVLLYNVGRIKYSSFKYPPSGNSFSRGKVYLEFTKPDGQVIKGEGDFNF